MGEAGDFRRHRTYYDVTLMITTHQWQIEHRHTLKWQKYIPDLALMEKF